MGWDTVTCWHRDGAGGWRRAVSEGVRLEATSASEPSSVGPAPGGQVRCFFFSPPDVEPGDAMAAGEVEGSAPPDDALEVREVEHHSVRRLYHHTEVVAR